MSKAKLTLYMDKKASTLAHKRARLSGKSISSLVKEYFIQKEKDAKARDIPDSIAKWIGVLKVRKTYRVLRDEQIGSRLKRYESLD